MKPNEVPIAEPMAPVRFDSRHKRIAHCLKHVFAYAAGQADDGEDLKEEEWRSFFKGNDDYIPALQEVRADRPNFKVDDLSKRYEEIGAAAIAKAREQGADHWHLVAYDRVEENGALVGKTATHQVFFVFDAKQGVFAVAKTIVSRDGGGAYSLKTVFRPHPDCKGKDFRRKAREKQERLRRQNFLLADHLNWE